MKSTFTFFLLLSLFFTLTAHGQTARLTGQVTDADDNAALPFINVAVWVEAKLVGTQTDFEGRYTLNVPSGTHQLLVSSIGYQSRELTVTVADNETKTVDVSLAEAQAILETVVVTGSKFEQTLGEQIVSLEVLKPEMVEHLNSTSGDQAIQRLGGVTVIDGQANIRGGSGFSFGAGSRVLLLVDDLPMLTADLGYPRWDFLPIENMEQIEVIKGASSVLYGSAAMNGIVNMRTTYPRAEPTTKVAMFNTIYQNPHDNEVVIYGTDSLPVDTVKKSWWGNDQPQEKGFSFSHRQRFNRVDWVLGGYFFDQTTWRATDFQRRGRLNTSLRHRFRRAPNLSVGLAANAQMSRGGTFLFWNGDEQKAYQPWSLLDTIVGNTALLTVDPYIEYFNAAKGMKQRLAARYYKNNNQTSGGYSTNSDLVYSEYQVQKRFSRAELVMTGGLTSSFAWVEGDLYEGGKHRSSNVGVYLQADKKFFDKLNVSVGGRFERNQIDTSAAEAKPVVRAGANYQAGEATFFRASYGQAYRFPTISEKYLQPSIGFGGIFPESRFEIRNGLEWRSRHQAGLQNIELDGLCRPFGPL